MIDFTNVNLERISIHQIGNKMQDEGMQLSEAEFEMRDDTTLSYLLKYFLTPFKNPEIYSFTHSSELELNEVYTFAKRIFDSADSLHKNSIEIARHLYNKSNHPKIKSGELCVCYFSKCNFQGEEVDAVGFFKSEDKDVVLKFEQTYDSFMIRHYNGANINKLDKGCIVFNIDSEDGFRVCVVDSNRSNDTQYWKDEFLQIKPLADDYHHTKNFLSVTKEYVTKQLTEEFDVTKTDQIDILNRSMEYFKSNDTFDKSHFENEVLQDSSIIRSFRSFDERFREENDLELSDNFDIAQHAVKRQAKIFKSVLKLDKNFHVYIHGNKDMIEQGVEPDGRKYYKLYYNEES